MIFQSELAEIRQREFPIVADWRYFDTATYGPHPARYVQRMTELAQSLSRQPLGDASAGIDRVRTAAAQVLHAPEQNVALLRSTGEGLNLLAGGLDWQLGDEVLLYELDFPSLIAPWLALGERGVVVQVVPDRGRNRFDADDFRRLVTPRTRAIAVSLVNNTTGFRAPVEDLAGLCRERDIWFGVDAVQAVGSTVVNAHSLGADVVAAHGYKFLLSGFGYAIAYVSERAIERLRVPHVGMSNMQAGDARTLFDKGLQLLESARRFEPSVPNLPAVLAMGESLDLLCEAGLEQIDAHIRLLCSRLTEGLHEHGYTLVTSAQPGESAGIVCVRKPHADQQSVYKALLAKHVVSAVRGGNLRFAPHLFNTADEVDEVLALLP